MSIIAFALEGLTKADNMAFTDVRDSGGLSYSDDITYQPYDAWNPGWWWYKKPVDGKVPGFGGRGWYMPTVGVIDYSDNPNKNEFWMRFAQNAHPVKWSTDTYWDIDFTMGRVLGTVNGALKVISTIRYAGGNLLLDIHSPTAGNDAVVYTQVLCTDCDSKIAVRNPNDNTTVFDIRLKLDEVAGFVQVYDYAGVRKGEFLGRTTNALKATHIAVATVAMSLYWNNQGTVRPALYSIAADECTFGMVVVSLSPKAEGSEQGQDAGSNGTGLFGRLRRPNITTPVKITPEPGVTKTYTMVPDNTTDINMPANYTVKAIKLHGAYETASTDNATVPISQILKFKTGGDIFTYPVDLPVLSNQVFAITGKLQVSGTQLNNNPKTGLPWTVSDLADIEYGFSVTGV